MIDFTGKTYAAILSAMLSEVDSKFDKREGGFIQTALGPAAYALEDFYLVLDQVQRSGFVQTAVGEDLDKLAVLAGLTRYPASPAVRLGVFNMDVPIGARFSTVNGAQSINFTVTARISAGRFQLTAETAGDTGNSYAGPILPITFLQGLTSAQLTGILVPGDDAEDDNSLRERVISALNERPFGGNIAAYRTEILAIDGVGAVQIYPVWNGGGTVKCSVLGADLLPASAVLVQAIQNRIDPPPNQGLGLGMAPIGAQVTITAPQTVTVDVSAAVDLAAGYTIGQILPQAQEAIGAYLLSIRKNWGTPVSSSGAQYAATVYLSQVLAALVGVDGVTNVTGVALNGGAADIVLTQSGQVQQVPILGEVTLSEA